MEMTSLHLAFFYYYYYFGSEGDSNRSKEGADGFQESPQILCLYCFCVS